MDKGDQFNWSKLTLWKEEKQKKNLWSLKQRYKYGFYFVRQNIIIIECVVEFNIDRYTIKRGAQNSKHDYLVL